MLETVFPQVCQGKDYGGISCGPDLGHPAWEGLSGEEKVSPGRPHKRRKHTSAKKLDALLEYCELKTIQMLEGHRYICHRCTSPVTGMVGRWWYLKNPSKSKQVPTLRSKGQLVTAPQSENFPDSPASPHPGPITNRWETPTQQGKEFYVTWSIGRWLVFQHAPLWKREENH